MEGSLLPPTEGEVGVRGRDSGCGRRAVAAEELRALISLVPCKNTACRECTQRPPAALRRSRRFSNNEAAFPFQSWGGPGIRPRGPLTKRRGIADPRRRWREA